MCYEKDDFENLYIDKEVSKLEKIKIIISTYFRLKGIREYIQCVLTDVSRTTYSITGKNYETGKEFNDCKNSSEALKWRRVISMSTIVDEVYSDHLTTLDTTYFEEDDFLKEVEEFRLNYETAIEDISKEIKEVCFRLEEITRVDVDKYAMDLFEKDFSRIAVEDNLQSYIELSKSLASEEVRNLRYNAKEDLLLLLDLITQYIETISWGKEQLAEFFFDLS